MNQMSRTKSLLLRLVDARLSRALAGRVRETLIEMRTRIVSIGSDATKEDLVVVLKGFRGLGIESEFLSTALERLQTD